MDENEIPKNLQTDDEEAMSLITSLPSDIDHHGTKLFKYQGCWYNYKTLQGILNFQRVPVLELRVYTETSKPDLTSFSSSPRLFSTHVPFHTLQEALKNTPCKIVYVWRNVKDALVSLWYFECANLKIEEDRSLLGSMFESFCRGVSYYGPFWEQVLSYWRGSLEDPKNVLFLRYEELKTEPSVQVKKLAEFLELCSLRNLKNLEINKNGKTARGVDHKNFFRKGEVGDSNHLTPEMEKRIDMILQEKFRASDLKM
ncbi:unnamed protein product [Microthlaspi erraticum]|uniref:Sulfotransferase n=1 Tax=Microthlaspi erraticum TaxID=1685480 RepID=A0A6D2HHY2_9BRAS|nr:unnamed protein product [Microthlaspi erraticum]